MSRTVRRQGRPGCSVLFAILSFACAACADDDDESSARDERDAGKRLDAGVPGSSPMMDVPIDASVQGPVEALPPLELMPLADASVGAACVRDDDCAAGRCLVAEPITNTPYPGGYCTGSCDEDLDCSERGLCVPGFRGRTGSCALRCDSDEACGRVGYRCRVASDAGRCAPGPRPLPDQAVGRACAAEDDCGGEAMTCATMLGGVAAPAGYCSQACAIDEDCGSGGRCINGLSLVTLPTGVCYQACVVPDGCRASYECRSLTGRADGPGVCAPLAN